jgi:hypothetical protein
MKITRMIARQNNKDLLNKDTLEFQEIEKLVCEIKFNVVYKSPDYNRQKDKFLFITNCIITEMILDHKCLSDGFINYKSRNKANSFKVINKNTFKDIF